MIAFHLYLLAIALVVGVTAGPLWALIPLVFGLLIALGATAE